MRRCIDVWTDYIWQLVFLLLQVCLPHISLPAIHIACLALFVLQTRMYLCKYTLCCIFSSTLSAFQHWTFTKFYFVFFSANRSYWNYSLSRDRINFYDRHFSRKKLLYRLASHSNYSPARLFDSIPCYLKRNRWFFPFTRLFSVLRLFLTSPSEIKVDGK